ncbi:hypothetical protein ES708_33721 [subsurface metagenome]
MLVAVSVSGFFLGHSKGRHRGGGKAWVNLTEQGAEILLNEESEGGK